MAGNSNSGRAPKPDGIKKLEGTYRKDREHKDFMSQSSEPAKIIKMPATPKDLGKKGREVWKKTGTMLAQKGVLSEIDMEAFYQMCKMYDTYDAMKEYLENPKETQAQDFYKAQTVYKAIKELWGEFGLTPKARMKLNAPEVADPNQSPLAKQLKKARQKK